MTHLLQFGQKHIGEGKPTLVIAEIGINHEGDVDVCAKTIEAAAQSGADAIKLQTCPASENYVQGTESFELFSKTELSQDETARMFSYTRELGMEIFTTSPDPQTLDWVDALDPAAHKISSGMMTNTVILRKTIEKGRSILISTGLAAAADIDEVFQTIDQYGDRNKIGLFQCTSLYPCPEEHLNLATIAAMEQKYSVPVGFSDHTIGDEMAANSVFAGAKFIEKHFTLDRTRPSFDHKISLEPQEMASMIAKIRRAETILGKPEKAIPKDLEQNTKKFLRSLIARKNIKKGDLLTEDNIGLKRPLPDKRGLDPKFYYEVLGKTALNTLDIDDPITKDDVN